MKNSKKILFLGRYKDQISIKILKLLNKKFVNVDYVFSKKHYEKLPKKFKGKKFDCVLSYRNYIVLTKKFLKLNKISINLHPGPPQYRGIGCLNFAIYNREKNYGVTCHFMKPKIDSGEIIISKNFLMPKNVTVSKLLKKTSLEGFKVLRKIILLIENMNYQKKLKEMVKINKKLKWSKKKYTKKDLEDLYWIKSEKNKNKLNLIIKSTLFRKFKPYIIKNNVKFFYNKTI